MLSCSVSISLKFAQREIIQCTHRWTCNLLEYINYSVYESITWSICTQYIHTIFVRYTLVRLGKEKRVGGGAFLLWMVLSPGFTFHWWCILHTHVPESSSSSQGISLKRWVVSAENDAASDSRYGTACLFQASGSLLYFDKSIRSEVWHFQFPLTQIYCLHKTLLPFKQCFCFIDSLRILFNSWLHCNSCLCLGCIPHSSVYFLSF